MPEVITSIINGKHIGEQGAEIYRSINPNDSRDTVADVHLASQATLIIAFQVASLAQESWFVFSPKKRQRIISRFKELLSEDTNHLAQLITRETGQDLSHSEAEVRQIAAICDLHIDSLQDVPEGTAIVEAANGRVRDSLAPNEVTCIISERLGTVADILWFVIPALLYGNAVVWKPANNSAASAQRLYELLARADLPSGVLNVVYATGQATSRALEKANSMGLVSRVTRLDRGDIRHG